MAPTSGANDDSPCSQTKRFRRHATNPDGYRVAMKMSLDDGDKSENDDEPLFPDVCRVLKFETKKTSMAVMQAQKERSEMDLTSMGPPAASSRSPDPDVAVQHLPKVAHAAAELEPMKLKIRGEDGAVVKRTVELRPSHTVLGKGNMGAFSILNIEVSANGREINSVTGVRFTVVGIVKTDVRA
ncbi:hypothetical protein CONLIGDRAFT_685929 [Coniochaeta ligniaria NRRL 30616]|uniref:Uncharacterized protein n=1 Tax=Coniochaeta ligniaria NRRL 30616 TaxID=1408157 RepID=A0A1J7IA27_9PEZI|nr:hypothetical protein CONLIGDRAFT_685929 [Coniochaeta ligniaria NRRL 30616]